MVIIPSAGNNNTGNNDVTGIGKTSVAHQIANSNATPAVCHAGTGIPAGAGKKRGINKTLNPINNPIFLVLVKNKTLPPAIDEYHR
jgi:hypothetical protein